MTLSRILRCIHFPKSCHRVAERRYLLQSKGFEIKESAKDKVCLNLPCPLGSADAWSSRAQEEETKQTIYELVDEARSLAGKFLDTAIE